MAIRRQKLWLGGEDDLVSALVFLVLDYRVNNQLHCLALTAFRGMWNWEGK